MKRFVAAPGCARQERWAQWVLVVLVCAAGCKKTTVRRETVGLITAALPLEWREKSRVPAPSAGLVERTDGRGSRVLVGWDVDERAGTPPLEEALRIAGLDAAHPEGSARVAGHSALLLRSSGGAALVWRCERTGRTLRLVVDGPRAPALEELAAGLDCHPANAKVNGELPLAASAALGSEWRLAHRGPGSAVHLRDEAVLTLFAGQIAPTPPDAAAAQRSAPSWALAAGLRAAVAESAGPADGPQGHPALRVSGTALLDGAPVRWVALSWRCLQRQRSFVALAFARRLEKADAGAESAAEATAEAAAEAAADPLLDSALLSARCHG